MTDSKFFSITVLFLCKMILTLSSQTVEYVALINSDNNTEVFQLSDEVDTIDISLTPNINFRAKTNPEPLGGGLKCSFELTPNGGATYIHVEGGAPYALFGDNSGNYVDWLDGFDNPPGKEVGDYTLVVKPGNGTHYTTKFFLKDGNNPPPPSGGYTVVLEAFTDFTKFTGINGFEPAYKDETRQCLAIDASIYKDKWAAAQATFTGEDGKYDITLHTLCEFDGESSYIVKIDGEQVGETFQNPEVPESEDYKPASITIEDISIRKGALVQVEFNSHSNGLIPEGNAFAYSRGRWTDVSFTLKSSGLEEWTQSNLPYIEEGGMVVIEPENVILDSRFALKTTADVADDATMKNFLGNGWIEWSENQYFGNAINDAQAKGLSTIKFIISTPGTYTFRWRNKQHNAGQTFDAGNDTFVKFASGTPQQSSGTKLTKAFVQAKNSWSWATNFEPVHGIFEYNPRVVYTAGEHSIQISGRSPGHSIDRIVLYHSSVSWNESKFNTANESGRVGSTTSIESENNGVAFAFSPNPTSDVLNITNVIPVKFIRILDMNGRVVLEKRNDFQIDNIDVSSLVKGIYYVSFGSDEHEARCAKMIKL